MVFLSFNALSVYSYTRAGEGARVHAAVPSTLNFQARLLQSNGAIVADGTYSVSFNLYTSENGGSAVWNEVHGTVQVRSGYLSVYLGTVDNDIDTLDWSQQYWLTMNVNGDGEMNPRLKLTSVPYAFRSGQADTLTNGAATLTANDLVQLSPSNIQAVSTALAALRINQTGAGLLAQLQGDGSDVFSIAKNGDVTSTGNATFSGGTLSLGAVAQTGGLTLFDGSGNTGTIRTAALGQNTTYTLPDPGSAGAEVCLNVGNCGGTGDVNNGGNFYGSAMTLGTNDPYALNLETDGITRLTLDTNGNANLTGALTAGTGLTVSNGGITVTGNSSIVGSLTGLTGLTSSGTVTLSGLGSGLVQASSTGVLSSGAVDRNGAAFFSGTLSVSNGGTGAGTFTTNGVMYGNGSGALQATAAGTGGQMLVANASGVPTYVSLSGDASLSSAGLLTLSNDAITTVKIADGNVTNAKLQNSSLTITAGTGLSGGGSVSLGGSTTVNLADTAVVANSYGSSTAIPTFTVDAQGRLIAAGSTTLANGALQNSSINLAYGTNLSGDASVALGGTLNLAITANPVFTSVTAATYMGNGAVTVSSGGAGALTLDSASNTLVLADSTLQHSGSVLNIDVNNAGLSTFSIVNNNGSNLANLDIEGAIFAGNNNAFQVSADGDITSVFTALDGSSTADGGAVSASTSLTLINASNFNVGNYVQMNSTDCGGTGVNVCYAKITAKSTNTLTITPSLTWSNGSVVNEYHVPELGGNNTSSTLINRYGRGYFISGVATGNGTTYYNEDSIESSLSTFNLLNTDVTTLNIGGAATTINLGTNSGSVNILGDLTTSGSNTITAAGGLIVTSGGADITGNSLITGMLQTSSTLSVTAGGLIINDGIDNNSGGITEAGAVSGVTSLSLTGAISGATASNTINGLVINGGALSSVAGITFVSGSLNLNSGGITNAGAIAGATTLSLSGAITAATSINTINGLIINSGALSGVTTLTASGAITSVGLNAGTGLIQNTGGLTSTGTISLNVNAGINTVSIGTGTTTGQVSIGGDSAPLVINSSAFDVSSTGALSGITTVTMSGAITAATATNTINGLIINAGTLSGITGMTFTSGSLNLNSGGITNTGSLAGVTTLNASGLITGTAGLTITGGAVNLNASSNFAVNIATGTTTGTVTIGGGTAPLVINSTNFDVTSAGAVSGVTTLDTSSNITTSGVYRIVQSGTTYIGAGTITCASNNYLGGMVVRGGIITSYGACNGVGLSDERLKTNVQQLTSTLDTVGNINLVTFDFDCDNQAFEIMNESCKEDRQTGVLAQQLATVFPELVYQDEFGYYRVKYDALNIYTLKAVAEVAKTVDSKGNIKAKTVATNSTVRIDENGVLQNINGLEMVSGGASITGGIDNNLGGLSEVGEVSGVTVLSAQRIVLSANGTEHLLELKKDGSGVFTVFNNGALELRLDSYQSFSVKTAGGLSAFTIDTINGQVRVGNGDPNKTVLFTLDTREAIDDPPGTNGSSYYNTKLKRFRCYQDDGWTDCLPVGTLNDPITLSRTVWNTMPNAETEFPGEPRILPNLTRAHEFKLRLRITAPGAENASCRLQFAANDNGPWEDLMDGGSGELSIGKAGTVTTEWLKLKESARDEVVLRVVCSGGNGLASPVFYGVSVQLR